MYDRSVRWRAQIKRSGIKGANVEEIGDHDDASQKSAAAPANIVASKTTRIILRPCREERRLGPSRLFASFHQPLFNGQSIFSLNTSMCCRLGLRTSLSFP